MTHGWASRRLALTAVPVGALALLLDQLTKSWAIAVLLGREPVHVIWTLQLSLSFNDGVAFSMLPGAGAWVVPVAIVVVVLVILTSRDLEGRAPAVAIGAVVGGAAGNLADRLFRGHGGAVVDWIDVQWWPVFNVADACVVCGGIALALLSLRAPPAPASARTGSAE